MDKIGLKKISVKNSMWELVSKIIEKIGTIIFTIILARFLLPEGFGAYSLAMTVSLIFIAFIDYAIDGALIRYVSSALGKNDKNLAKNYFNFIFRKKILFSFVMASLLLILAYPLSVYFFKKVFLFPLFFLSGFYIFILSIENSYSSLFYIFNYTKGKAIKEILKQILRILITILIFLFVAKIYYIGGIILGLTLTNLIILIFIFFYTKRFAFFLFDRGDVGVSEKKKVMKFIYYLLVGGATGLIFSYVDLLMLGVFLSEIKYIGLYSAAMAFVWGIAGFLSFNSVFLPIFTKIKNDRIETSLNYVLKYSLMLTIPISFGIVALSKFILFFIYGAEYVEASIVLSLMAFLIVETVNGSFIITVFSAREQPKFITKITIFSLLINIVLNFILIKTLLYISPLWALTGAIIATLISRYFALIALSLIMKKKLKITLILADWIRPFIASILMFLFLFLLNNYIVKDMTLIAGILEITTGILIYILSMFSIKGITKKDLQNFKEILARQ